MKPKNIIEEINQRARDCVFRNKDPEKLKQIQKLNRLIEIVEDFKEAVHMGNKERSAHQEQNLMNHLRDMGYSL